MKLSIGGKIGIGYGLILTALVVVGVVSFRNLRQLNSDAGWVLHTVQVLRSIQSLSSQVTEAESSERGYLLTRTPAFLDQFHGLQPQIQQTLRDLRSLTADNPSQQARLDRLDPLVADRLALLEKVIGSLQARGKLDAEATALMARGQEEMAEFRPLLRQMEGEEQQLLDRRRGTTQAAEWVTSLTILGGTLLALLLGVGVGSVIVRGIAASLRSLNAAAERLGAGDYSQRAEVTSQDDLGTLAKAFNQMAGQVEQRQEALAEQEWLKGNLARCRALFQGQRDLAAAGRALTSEIAEILGVRHASLYLAEADPEAGQSQPVLRWRAGYAAAGGRREIRPGEGLIGQCFVERKAVFLDEVPPDYLRIESALGAAAPPLPGDPAHPVRGPGEGSAGTRLVPGDDGDPAGVPAGAPERPGPGAERDRGGTAHRGAAAAGRGAFPGPPGAAGGTAPDERGAPADQRGAGPGQQRTGGTRRTPRRAAGRAGDEEPGNRAGPARAGGEGGPAYPHLEVQVGVPRQHVPRAAHAAEQPPHPGEDPGRERGGEPPSEADPVRRDDPRRGERPPAADQRHLGPREDRVGHGGGRGRRHGVRGAGAVRRELVPAARGDEAPRVPGRARSPASGDAPHRHAAGPAGGEEPPLQRVQVHRARLGRPADRGAA